jgi:hypothetical protein
MHDDDQPTKERFLDDIKNHKLQIIKDDGVYRHLICSNGSFNCRYEIITWPNFLAYVGDMGDYVFSRVEDMLTFFRRGNLDDINPGYWSEKVKAESVFGSGIKHFSVERFRECVLSDVRSHLNLEEDEKIPDDMMEEIEPLMETEDEWESIETIRNFSSKKINFDDFYEHSLETHTYYYIWCCYAIVWAIAEYDKFKEAHRQ